MLYLGVNEVSKVKKVKKVFSNGQVNVQWSIVDQKFYNFYLKLQDV